MALTSLLAIFCVGHLKLKKELNTSSWLSLTLRNSGNDHCSQIYHCMTSMVPTLRMDSSLSDMVLFFYLNVFSVLTISLLGKSHAAPYTGNSACGFQNFWIPNTSTHQIWASVSIDMWWLRGSFLNLFSTQQNCFSFHDGGRKWSL